MSLTVNQLAKPVKVKRKIQETQDSVSLELDIPDELKNQFKYTSGQFVTFFLNFNGETLARSYSICTSPLTDTEFKVMVKKVQGGRASTYLCDELKEGDVLMTTPPAGHFFKASSSVSGTHYYLFCAGSGITPVISILKTVLKSSDKNHVTLTYCNRNENSIVFRTELDRLAEEYSSRLNITHVLSKPTQTQAMGGRLQESTVLQTLKAFPTRATQKEFYLCGPTEFMGLVRTALLNAGVSKDLIREENFGDSLPPKNSLEVKGDWIIIGDESSPNESPEKIIAMISGETFEVPAKAGQSVLETLLEAGAQPPYSCMDGACMACLAKVEGGKVYQEDLGILSEDNVKLKETLTCQAKPLSRIVKLSYDNL